MKKILDLMLGISAAGIFLAGLFGFLFGNNALELSIQFMTLSVVPLVALTLVRSWSKGEELPATRTTTARSEIQMPVLEKKIETTEQFNKLPSFVKETIQREPDRVLKPIPKPEPRPKYVPEQSVAEELPIEPPKEIFKCTKCEKEFEQKSKLQRHYGMAHYKDLDI